MNNYNPFEAIKDSSVWVNNTDFTAVRKDPFIRIGIIKEVTLDEDTSESIYLVEIRDKTDKVFASCRMMTRFGGAYNYEDVIGRGYTSIPGISLEPDDIDTRAGDTVVVAFLNGETRYGIILGGLNHPARETDLSDEEGPWYKSEFNGVETEINSDGEYTLTVKGQPINLALLEAPPKAGIIDPVYNEIVNSTYMTFDMDGGWIVSDNSAALEQHIEIVKSPGTIEIAAGEVSILLDKSSMDISMDTTTMEISSSASIDMTTAEFSVEADISIKMKATQVAIGSDTVELLDLLAQLIDALGQVTAISPIGPCTPLMATPQWPQILQLKAKLVSITGSL